MARINQITYSSEPLEDDETKEFSCPHHERRQRFFCTRCGWVGTHGVEGMRE